MTEATYHGSLLHGVWNLPGPGNKYALVGGFLSTVVTGKSGLLLCWFLLYMKWISYMCTCIPFLDTSPILLPYIMWLNSEKYLYFLSQLLCFPGGSVVKNSPANAGDTVSIPGLGRSLQYSCLGKPMDEGAWWATVHWVTKKSDKTLRLNNKVKVGS